MISANRVRPACLRAVLAALALAVLSGTAGAEMSWHIHDSDEVLASFTRLNAGGLAFADPAGFEWDLIMSVDDPAILNHGSGSFFPVDAEIVEDAMAGLEHGCPGLNNVEIFILPYPRRSLLDSSADDRGIYLSPGVYPRTPEQVHALVTHELGHVLHRRLLDDSDREGWDAYRRLRGIEDATVYNDQAAHRNRPHEIFAEDFRVLFGGALANYSHSIENPNLVYSTAVAGLRDFMAAMSLPHGEPLSVEAGPIPSRGGQLITIRVSATSAGSPVTLHILDVRGRLVRSFAAVESAPEFSWDGSDESGIPAPSGVYFALIEAGSRRNVTRLVVTR